LIEDFLRGGEFAITTNFFENLLIKINHCLIDFMYESKFFQTKTIIREKLQTYIVYHIKGDFSELEQISLPIPSLVPPEKFTLKGKNCFGDLAVKKITKGSSSAQLSVSTVDFLNKIGTKKMKLNPEAIKVIVDEVESGDGPIKNSAQLQKLFLQVESLQTPSFLARKEKFTNLQKREKGATNEQTSNFLTKI